MIGINHYRWTKLQGERKLLLSKKSRKKKPLCMGIARIFILVCAIGKYFCCDYVIKTVVD